MHPNASGLAFAKGHVHEFRRLARCLCFGIVQRPEVLRIRCEDFFSEQQMQDVIEPLLAKLPPFAMPIMPPAMANAAPPAPPPAAPPAAAAAPPAAAVPHVAPAAPAPHVAAVAAGMRGRGRGRGRGRCRRGRRG